MQTKYKLLALSAGLLLMAAGCTKAATTTSTSTGASTTTTQPSGTMPATTTPTSTTPATTPPSKTTPPTPPPAAAAPKAQSFTLNADDTSTTLSSITVPKGTPVTITFNVNANTTYHGGLDFRSPNVNTGTITPGSSKTLTFTATSSFVFTPYWPSTNIQKPYTIAVNVQ